MKALGALSAGNLLPTSSHSKSGFFSGCISSLIVQDEDSRKSF